MNRRLIIHTTDEDALTAIREDAGERRVVIHETDAPAVLRDAQGINVRQASASTSSLIVPDVPIIKIRQNEATTITLLTN